jgi:hypothetical protein
MIKLFGTENFTATQGIGKKKKVLQKFSELCGIIGLGG